IDSTKDDVFKMADCFDAAIHGEGEYPLLEICQHIRQHGSKDLETCLEGVSNVIYRARAGKIFVHESRSFLNELDDLPSVDYDMIDIHKYSIPTMAGKYVLSMMLSRGCPFKCTFCDAPITMGTKLRFWSTPRVLADIRHYVEKYGVTN